MSLTSGLGEDQITKLPYQMSNIQGCKTRLSNLYKENVNKFIAKCKYIYIIG